MKTPFTFTQNIQRSLTLFGMIMITLLVSNNAHAQVDKTDEASTSNQDIIVKGIVSDAEGPLLGANILLKGTTIGTASDENGAFTFPKALKPNDVLVFNYLGYETKEVTIKNNTKPLKVVLYSDTVEILGALVVDKPYKSKRKKSK